MGLRCVVLEPDICKVAGPCGIDAGATSDQQSCVLREGPTQTAGPFGGFPWDLALGRFWASSGGVSFEVSLGGGLFGGPGHAWMFSKNGPMKDLG